MPAIDDILFEMMANEYRRQLLFTLLERGPSDLPINLDTPPDSVDIDPAAPERYHVHLPKLADYGFVEWNRTLNTVEPGPRFETHRPVLELLAEYRGSTASAD